MNKIGIYGGKTKVNRYSANLFSEIDQKDAKVGVFSDKTNFLCVKNGKVRVRNGNLWFKRTLEVSKCEN
jgi:hypothetical protein